MPSLTNLLIVSVVAFAAPFVLGLFPRLRLPSVVLEIVAGIVIGPSVLGIVDADEAVAVIALMGLTFVLFLAGLEIDLRRLRGPVLRLTALAFAASFGVGIAVSLGLKAAGLVDTPLLVAIILCATSLALLVGFAAIAQQLGLEAILGAFIAGAVISLVDADRVMTHPDFRRKLEAIGFGFFIPVFFVTSGVRFDLDALTASASNLAMVPVFLAALLVVRGLPAVVYRRVLDGRHTAIAGIMQATSLPFIVAATAIGMDLGLIDAAASAALIGAGLLSVLIFPLAGLLLLRRAAPEL